MDCVSMAAAQSTAFCWVDGFYSNISLKLEKAAKWKEHAPYVQSKVAHHK